MNDDQELMEILASLGTNGACIETTHLWEMLLRRWPVGEAIGRADDIRDNLTKMPRPEYVI